MTTLNFENPPILEAVFDISIVSESENIIEHLKNTNGIFKKDFPKQKEIFEGKFSFSLDPSISSDHTKTLIGFSCATEDNDILIQRRVNGFSFHKLKQYYGGDKFRDEAIKYWELNSNTFKDKINTNRIGLRFINLVKTYNKPINQVFAISIAKTDQIGNLSKIAYNYSLKLENDYNATINLYPANNDDYLLDIDISKIFSPSQLTKEEIEEHFNFMRDKKNLIFSKTLKKSILNQYKPIKITNE